MSLKAKIEAVIYASEEPVTIPQLVSLLGVEAQAELDTLDAQQGSLLPLEDGVFEKDVVPEEDTSSDGLDLDALNAETLGSSAEDAAAPVTRNNDAEKRETRERERRLRDHFRSILDHLMVDFANGDRGLEIREVAGGFRFATKPEFHDTVRGFVRSLKPPLKLSLQALETLAVVAYKQPVTAPEISEIRGVDSGGVLGSLIARKLITTAGRKQVIGRPILYKTTREFLLRFGLKDTSELPSIEEFEKMAGELAEAVQEEIDMEQASAPNRSQEAVDAGDSPTGDERNTTPSELSSTMPSDDVPANSEAVEPMRDVHEAQADGVPDSTEAPGSNEDASSTSRE